MLLNKTPIKYLLPVILMLFWVQGGLAQNKPGSKSKDFFRVKSPKIQYVKPDTTVLLESADYPDEKSGKSKSQPFNPAKKLSIVNEDTSTLDLGEQSIVEVSEEMQIDSTWIKVASYYAIWD